MRRVIKGKIYDTKTATHIANDSRYPVGDFNHYDEDLYGI